MPFMHEATADGAGAGVEILIAAPDGEVGIPVVQLQWRIADRVREVQAHCGAGAARSRDQRRQVQQLPGEILHTGQKHQAQAAAFPLDALDHILGSQCTLAGPRLNFDQMPLRLEAVKFELRNDGVAVRRKRRTLDQHGIARRVGPEETDHHQVQIHREGVHGNDFVRHRARQFGERRRGALVIGNPRTRGGGVAEHPQAPPIAELLFDHRGSGLGLQPQGMAAEVPQLAALSVVRMMKLLRKAGERVRRILCLRLGLRALRVLRAQAGACMTVPQTLHVRRARLE